MVDAAKNALNNYDFVFLHINGTDILSHDAKRKEKTVFITKIDQALTPLLEDLSDKVAIITCDHCTDSDPNFKEYRHLKDPVPVVIAGAGMTPNKVDTFGEHAAMKGFALKGNDLVSYVMKVKKRAE
jgi:2,3-bisphosphoglycerate-independent phosphoglycerate mutase